MPQPQNHRPLDRRYRQPKQYVLLATLTAITVLYGLWIAAGVNPLAAKVGLTIFQYQMFLRVGGYL
jgi:hypothetical protein